MKHSKDYKEGFEAGQIVGQTEGHKEAKFDERFMDSQRKKIEGLEEQIRTMQHSEYITGFKDGYADGYKRCADYGTGDSYEDIMKALDNDLKKNLKKR